jgi:hypothetical protein
MYTWHPAIYQVSVSPVIDTCMFADPRETRKVKKGIKRKKKYGGTVID